jgi:hypothetical protein
MNIYPTARLTCFLAFYIWLQIALCVPDCFASWSKSQDNLISTMEAGLQNRSFTRRGTPQSLAHAAKQSRRGEQRLTGAKISVVQARQRRTVARRRPSQDPELFDGELAKLN